jgi:hypothetical protein
LPSHPSKAIKTNYFFLFEDDDGKIVIDIDIQNLVHAMRSQFNHPINKLQAICVQNHPPQTHLL